MLIVPTDCGVTFLKVADSQILSNNQTSLMLIILYDPHNGVANNYL